MNIDELRAFLGVLDHGSVAAASQALGEPRSTVRARIDTLEAALERRLFVRTAKGAHPTPDGLALDPEARAIVFRLETLPTFLRDAARTFVGTVHLRLPVGLPPELAALWAAELRRRHPGLRLRASHADDPALRVPEDVDLVLHFGPSVPRGPFRTSVIAWMPEKLVASPAYLDARGRPRTAEELRAHDLLSWLPPGEDGRSWPLREGGSIEVDPFVLTSDVHSVRRLAAMGLGIARLPEGTVPTTTDVEGLEDVLPDLVGRPCALRLVVPEARAGHPRVRACVQLLREVAQGTLGLTVDEPTADPPDQGGPQT